MILKFLLFGSFILQHTWSGGRDTTVVEGDTIKTFFNAFQIDPFSSSDTLFISRDSLFLVPSSRIFDSAGFEVRGISCKSEDTVFVGVFKLTSTQVNYKVFYTVDSLFFTTGRILYDAWKTFESVKRMFFLKDYGNALWIGARSTSGWIFFSPDLSVLPPPSFVWTNSGASVYQNKFSDFLAYSSDKLYCSTDKGKILRYLKNLNEWEVIYTYPSASGSEPDAEALFKTKNGLGIGFEMPEDTGVIIYETTDDVNFYPISPLLPVKTITGGIYSEKSDKLIIACNFPASVFIIENDTFKTVFQDYNLYIDYIFKANNGIIYMLAHSENTYPLRRVYSSYDGISWNLI